MNTKTNNNKRVYKKPAVTAIKVDNEISLVMMSGTPPPPPISINPLKFFR